MRPTIGMFSPVPDFSDGAFNTLGYDLQQVSGRTIKVEDVNITADNESKTFNIFEFTGTVVVLDQYAMITADTALTNCTGVYADIWDGTAATDLTSDGAILSGAPIGSYFTKDMVSTSPYSVMLADQARLLETANDRFAGRPFTINAKNGATNYIRFNLTTNTTLDFTMNVYFVYLALNGSTLTLV